MLYLYSVRKSFDGLDLTHCQVKIVKMNCNNFKGFMCCWCKVTWFVLLLVAIATGKCSSFSIKSMKNITVTTGQDVLLRCEFDKGGLSRSWSHSYNSRSPVVIYANEVKMLQNPQISLMVDNEREFTIGIEKVTAKNEGLYTCTLYKDVAKTSSMYLTVNIRPRIVKVSKDRTVDEGSLVRLQCLAEGKPKPKIYWRHIIPSADGYRATTEFLPLGKVTRASAGNYECTADNGISSPVTRSIKLVVRYPPEIQESGINKLMVVPDQQGAMECNAAGVPNPIFTWRGPSGQMIETERKSGRYNMLELNQGNIVQSKLYIDKMLNSDYGNWTCRASNALGSGEQIIIVNKKILPPTRLPPTLVFGTSKFQKGGENGSNFIYCNVYLVLLHTVFIAVFTVAM